MSHAAVLRKGKALHLKGIVEAEGQFELCPDLTSLLSLFPLWDSSLAVRLALHR